MKNFCVFITLFVAIMAIANANYSDCGSTLGKIEAIEISDCDSKNDPKCILHRGTNATVKITFTPNKNVNEVMGVVHGVVADIPFPFNLPNPNGCVESGLVCPLHSGETYTYEATLPVLKKYPRVTVDVKWELQNEDGGVIICLLIPAKLE